MEIAVGNPGRILGHLVSNSNRVELKLPSNELLKVDGDMRDMQIVCQRGRLWITQVDDDKDYILRAGERFVVTRPGLVLVQSLREGRCDLLMVVERAAAA